MRELVNTWNPTVFQETKINSMVQNNSNMDMDINILRGRSASSSTNSSSVSSAHLDLSSILYYKRIEVESSKLTWDKQVDLNEREDFSLSYTTPKVGENKLADKITDHTPKDGKQHSNIEVLIPNNMLIPQGEGVLYASPLIWKTTSPWWCHL